MIFRSNFYQKKQDIWDLYKIKLQNQSEFLYNIGV